MAVRDIRLFGDPILKTVCDPVLEITETVRSLVSDLEQTTSLPGRAGVAANQIGVNLRIFSYLHENVVSHLINPEIIELSGELVEVEEGCLSLPEIWSMTPRYSRVSIRALKLSGEEVEIEAEGFLAQIFQHEIDHLNGKTYLDRLEPPARKLAMAALRETDWFMRG